MAASVRCMVNQFRKWGKSPRIWMVFILFAIFVSTNFIASIRVFCQQYQVSCSIWTLPLALTMRNRRLWIMLLPILLFCDAPFLDQQQPFLIIRIGRTRWAVGQILYILAASVVFYLGCMLITVLLLFPHVTFTLDWGKVLHTLTQPHVTWNIRMDVIPASVLQQYSAIQATILCGAVMCIVTSFLGLLMFLCNLWAKREVGILVASFFVGFAYFIEIMSIPSRSWNTMRYFSPATWVDLSQMGHNNFRSPSWSYIFIFGILLLVILIIGILLSVRKKSIDVIQSL